VRVFKLKTAFSNHIPTSEYQKMFKIYPPMLQIGNKWYLLVSTSIYLRYIIVTQNPKICKFEKEFL
jgi:hypothetical protein